MSTCLELITQAYYRSGVLPFGVDINAPEDQIGLEHLQGMFNGWVASGMFGQLIPTHKYGEGAYEAKERELVVHGTADTITLPVTVTDAGTPRPPMNCAIIVSSNRDTGVFTRYVYDAFVSAWISIEGLALADYVPLSSLYDEQLKNLLAVYIGEQSGVNLNPLLLKKAGNAKVAIASRQGVPRRRDVGSYM